MMKDLYESAPPETLDRIVADAESLLQAQLQTAIAADQRALTFAGLLVAALAALVGLSDGNQSLWFTGVVATLTGLSASCALWSARPTTWSFAGSEPFQWKADLEEGWPLHKSLAELASNRDAALQRNHVRLNRAAMAMRVSLCCAGLAIFVAIIWAWAG